jgi:predicted RNA-binding Zn ribbon-like protein
VAAIETPETIDLWGGALCLDLANSVDRDPSGAHVAPERTDVLRSGGELARWAARVGVPIAPPDDRELATIRALRDALHRLFSALAAGERPAPADLDELQRSVAAATAAGTWAAGDAGAWRLAWRAEEPAAVRFAAAIDAQLLLSDAERLARVTRCPGRDCGWLFINASGRRKWCSMSACGSREKMRRMAARRRPAAEVTR